jgi:tetratricopeptide (TPR) repeat protein
VGETLHRALNGKLVAPRKRTGDRTIPADLEAVCTKALARRAEKRYQTAGEMAAALRGLLPDEGRTTEMRRPSRRSPMVNAAVVSGAVVVLVTLGALLFGTGGSDEGADASDRTDQASDEPSDGADVSDVSDERPDVSDEPSEVSDEPSDASDRASDEPATGNEEQEAEERAAELAKQGRAELKRMRLDRAGALFREALEADPKLSAAWFGLGRVAFEQARYGEAEARVRRALRFRSRSARYRNFLGQVLLTQGKKEAAIAEWKKVLDLRPGNAEAKRLLKAAGVGVE